MATGTNKPVGSADPRDLLANAINLDEAVNDAEAIEWTDRKGQTRKTWRGVEMSAPISVAASEAAASSALDAKWAAEDAARARDGAMVGAVFYQTEPEGRAAVADGETFKVIGSGAVAAYLYRRTSENNSELLAELPAAEAVGDLQQLISKLKQQELIEAVVDEEGGIHRVNTPLMTQDRVHRVEEIDNGGAILSEDGGVMIYQDEERTVVGPLDLGHTDLPGVFVVDEDGGVHAALAGEDSNPEAPAVSNPLSAGAFFSGVLVGAQGVPICLHAPSLIAERLRAGEVIATLNSNTAAEAVSGSDELKFTTDSLGAIAQLVLRQRTDPTVRLARSLVVKTVPVPAVDPQPIRILYIGDSIGNRQGLQFIQSFFTSWGYVPEWIGTMRSSAVPNNANDITGPLGECREGWETGDYTRALTERGVNIAPGGEAEYMAMAKADKWLRNPFVREQSEADDPSDVRNGLVMDFSFYQTRFGLQAPDVVVWAMGTNDVRDRTEAEIYSAVNSNDALFYRRIKTAWPAAKIIRTVPGTAIDPLREAVWTSKYIPMLRAVLDAASGVAGVTVAPTWAMANQEAAYSFAASPDPTTGFTSLTAGWSDAIHPIGALRVGLYQALAPYIAAAGINIT